MVTCGTETPDTAETTLDVEGLNAKPLGEEPLIDDAEILDEAAALNKDDLGVLEVVGRVLGTGALWVAVPDEMIGAVAVAVLISVDDTKALADSLTTDGEAVGGVARGAGVCVKPI